MEKQHIDILQTVFILMALGAAGYSIYNSHYSAKWAKAQLAEHEKKTG